MWREREEQYGEDGASIPVLHQEQKKNREKAEKECSAEDIANDPENDVMTEEMDMDELEKEANN